MMFDHQRVTMPATHSTKDGRATTQRQRMDEIEHVLEKAGVTALIDRAADDQCIAMLDLRDQGFGLLIQCFAIDGKQVRPGV